MLGYVTSCFDLIFTEHGVHITVDWVQTVSHPQFLQEHYAHDYTWHRWHPANVTSSVWLQTLSAVTCWTALPVTARNCTSGRWHVSNYHTI